ncbi:bifunctional UDP-3-O-[3-hydroxymyristoyl] N-acetylglucosamine deacetylase/3-hydroxyacyl-ACP dehydratase [Segetibacter sp. 3557_3]|uniref:bifunctional UDP-3-O-[3-hydroxymyristoyl] N-acetylglucosamine deacetylase/3-hydroxyacyl-ACP dehydratase n=1 Tax=Segetibacter sp. 3557_3 TaxID=2547429 RepID=UPI001058889C|nr:bifunctional UDP-3-O-[3-hydroxymyristoyl] N-acetylglucosamine deacetylase/3-hydroxyacyl-ACP dehydratase [Segetibacter sp. 3557_3]TDH19834.1 bifunctional UDP-3-O-[3-hydroxymyristoyl] N-acetylglucosamine deacetylase/3-hydroxyacyl-ACP dehydratase [Segetibacter sp. 3557_3]
MEVTNTNGSSFQHTIKQELAISGAGIHTGQAVTMTIKPAEPNSGITFQRVDLTGKPTIKADVDNVVETNRSTTLQSNGARVSTIEHLMAALVGMQIDNVLIEIDGEEVPILDGSSQPFIEALEQTGVIEQNAPKVYYTIDRNIIFVDEHKKVEMVALPYNGYRVNTLIDFNSPVLGTQHASLKNIADFKTEIAPCRTFCFFHELELLLDNNLIKGGDINNAIVVVDKPVTEEQVQRISKVFNKEDVKVNSEGILNNLELRFPNEPARHKLLDVIGDLALVGFPFKAHIIASRPGHASNVQFAKKIKEHIKKYKNKVDVPKYDPNQPALIDIHEIEKTLPHRYPFLLVDKVMELTEKVCIAVKNVTYNEPFFQGHFPGNYVMPGVLQVEALAQTGGFLAIPRDTEDQYDTYFLKIESCKFKQKVVPGDTLILRMELLQPIRRGICEMKGTIFVGDKLITEAVLVAQIVKRPKA